MNTSDWALPGLVIVYLWKNVGFAALIYLAGLQGLPQRARRGRRRSTAPSTWTRFRRDHAAAAARRSRSSC